MRLLQQSTPKPIRMREETKNRLGPYMSPLLFAFGPERSDGGPPTCLPACITSQEGKARKEWRRQGKKRTQQALDALAFEPTYSRWG